MGPSRRSLGGGEGGQRPPGEQLRGAWACSIQFRGLGRGWLLLGLALPHGGRWRARACSEASCISSLWFRRGSSCPNTLGTECDGEDVQGQRLPAAGGHCQLFSFPHSQGVGHPGAPPHALTPPPAPWPQPSSQAAVPPGLCSKGPVLPKPASNSSSPPAAPTCPNNSVGVPFCGGCRSSPARPAEEP